MKKTLIFIIISLITKTLLAQASNFEAITEYSGSDNFTGLDFSALAVADINNDSHIDLLVSGQGPGNIVEINLYTNDGYGNYIEVMETPFEGVFLSSIAFADIDNDNDQDVLITGRTQFSEFIAKLYTNDGTGNFTEVTETPFEGVIYSSIEFSDINNDNNIDVLITGQNILDELIAKAFTNDGDGNFTEMTSSSINGLAMASFVIVDFDNDNNKDIILTGYDSEYDHVTNFYTNDGNGNFNEVTETPFENVAASSIASADIDNDGDQDILITGNKNTEEIISELYINDGTGSFTQDVTNNFQPIKSGSVAFADIDNDNDQDVFITGLNNSDNRVAITYTNDGTGLYTEHEKNVIFGVTFGSIAFADVDNDNDLDLFISGTSNRIISVSNSIEYPITELYMNNGEGFFSTKQNSPFSGVSTSSVAFADIDNDNDQDILITGSPNHYLIDQSTRLYTNNGTGAFSIKKDIPIIDITSGSVAFEDIDNDNDLDLLISGTDSSLQAVTKLYTNDGIGNFTEVTETPFEGVTYSSIAFADIDNDNDQDLLISGQGIERITQLFTNDGTGTYTQVLETPFEGVSVGTINFFDANNNNNIDVLITGLNDSIKRIAKLYTNDGTGYFTEVIETPFEPVSTSSIATGDINNDNNIDVLITGTNNEGEDIAKIYTNDGIGNFIEIEETPLQAVTLSSVILRDLNNDNYKDILITGRKGSYERIAKLYYNDGTGNFIEVEETPFIGVAFGSLASADIDGDNDLDIILTGGSSVYPTDNIAKLYRNKNANEIKENETHALINIYPNPSTDLLVIQLNNNEEVSVKIFDYTGKCILQKRFINTINLDVKEFKNGLYMLEINSEKKTVTKKVIKI